MDLPLESLLNKMTWKWPSQWQSTVGNRALARPLKTDSSSSETNPWPPGSIITEWFGLEGTWPGSFSPLPALWWDQVHYSKQPPIKRSLLFLRWKFSGMEIPLSWQFIPLFCLFSCSAQSLFLSLSLFFNFSNLWVRFPSCNLSHWKQFPRLHLLTYCETACFPAFCIPKTEHGSGS